MTGFLVTAGARIDLDEIIEFVGADKPAAARELNGDFFDAFERLAALPRAGHLRLELAPASVRFWVVRTYLIAYRADENPIVILRVLSGHRDLAQQITWGVSEDVEVALAAA